MMFSLWPSIVSGDLSPSRERGQHACGHFAFHHLPTSGSHSRDLMT
jgi:hypothetical protein